MDIQRIRKDFPFLERTKQAGRPLVYFDNAATTQKPACVIDCLSQFYANGVANIRRGVYRHAEDVTMQFEHVRELVAAFISAPVHDIIFTSGTTAGINLVATSWGMQHLGPGDQIIISLQEHHSNLLPWQQVARVTGAQLCFIPLTKTGQLDVPAYERMLNPRVKLVAIAHVPNVLGLENDVPHMARLAHALGARVLVDAAQSAGHCRVDVGQLGADFLAFSGHKMLGPTGVGVLYIKKELQDVMEPYQRGGGMVFSVHQQDAQWAAGPQKFEAGTPPIAQVIGLGCAIEYLTQQIDFDELARHEAALAARFLDGLAQLSHIRVIGPLDALRQYGRTIAFYHEHIHAHDVAAYLDAGGIALRAGHHCAQPFHDALGLSSTVRASFYLYNTEQEVDAMLDLLASFSR